MAITIHDRGRRKQAALIASLFLCRANEILNSSEILRGWSFRT